MIPPLLILASVQRNSAWLKTEFSQPSLPSENNQSDSRAILAQINGIWISYEENV